MNQQYEYVNRARGLGILLVILGHSTLLPEGGIRFIASFHMPLFFMISGVLFFYQYEKERTMWEEFLHRFRKLMIPYFAASLLYMILRQELSYRKLGFFDLELLKSDIFSTISLEGISVLWFLTAMFFSQLLFAALKNIQKKQNMKKSPYLLFDLSFVLFFLLLLFFGKSWYVTKAGVLLGRCLLSFEFLYLGFRISGFIRILLNGISWHTKKYRSQILFFIGISSLFLCFLLGANQPTVDMHYMIYDNLLVMIEMGVLGSFGILLLAKMMPNVILGKWFSYFGKHSLFIMMTHLDVKIISVSLTLSGKLLGKAVETYPVLRFLVFFVLVIGIQVGMIELLAIVKKRIRIHKNPA